VQRSAFSKRVALRAATIAAVLAIAALGCATLVGCNGLFYYPDARIHGTPLTHGLVAVEELAFSAPDGPRLHGWWVPAVGTASGTVVYCHGNYGNLTLHAGSVRWLPRRGFNLLIFDYRGYGASEGEVERAGTVADAVAAIDVALGRDPDRTVVFGHSLGGAIGMVAAAQRPQVRAVIAESTFASYRDAAWGAAPWLLRWLTPLVISSGHDPIDSLAEISPRPLLVIHGTDDDITPFYLGEALFAAAQEPKEFLPVEGTGHFSPWFALGADFEDAIVAFCTRAVSR